MAKLTAGGVLGTIWEKAFADTVSTDLADVMKVAVDKFRECMESGAGGAKECLRRVAGELKLGAQIKSVYEKHKTELRSATGPAWQLFLGGIRRALSNAIKGMISDAYRDCITKTGESAKDCYKRVAREKKIGDELSKVWAAYEIELADEVLGRVLERMAGLA